MGMIGEFKEFAMRGNVVDLAVGVVIGAAFGKIVTALVDGIVMPLIGLLDRRRRLQRLDDRARAGAAWTPPARRSPRWLLRYGDVHPDACIDFVLVAFAIFLVRQGDQPPAPQGSRRRAAAPRRGRAAAARDPRFAEDVSAALPRGIARTCPRPARMREAAALLRSRARLFRLPESAMRLAPMLLATSAAARRRACRRSSATTAHPRPGASPPPRSCASTRWPTTPRGRSSNR